MTFVIHDMNVQSVYSGKPGCRGKHTYRSSAATTAAQRGGAVNNRVVLQTLAKMKALAESGESDVTVNVTPKYVSVELPTRCYIAYFNTAENTKL